MAGIIISPMDAVPFNLEETLSALPPASQVFARCFFRSLNHIAFIPSGVPTLQAQVIHRLVAKAIKEEGSDIGQLFSQFFPQCDLKALPLSYAWAVERGDFLLAKALYPHLPPLPEGMEDTKAGRLLSAAAKRGADREVLEILKGAPTPPIPPIPPNGPCGLGAALCEAAQNRHTRCAEIILTDAPLAAEIQAGDSDLQGAEEGARTPLLAEAFNIKTALDYCLKNNDAPTFLVIADAAQHLPNVKRALPLGEHLTALAQLGEFKRLLDLFKTNAHIAYEIRPNGPKGLGHCIVLCVQKGAKECVKRLLTLKQAKQIHPEGEMSIAHSVWIAAGNEEWDCLELLLAHRPTLQTEGNLNFGHSLCWAASSGRALTVQALAAHPLTRQLHPKGQFSISHAIVCAASAKGDGGIDSLLALPQAKEMAIGPVKYTLGNALYRAAHRGNVFALKRLSEHPDIQKVPGEGLFGMGYVLQSAVDRSHAACVELLIPFAKTVPRDGEYGIENTWQKAVSKLDSDKAALRITAALCKLPAVFRILSDQPMLIASLLDAAISHGEEPLLLQLMGSLPLQLLPLNPAGSGLNRCIARTLSCGWQESAQLLLKLPQAKKISCEGDFGIPSLLLRSYIHKCRACYQLLMDLPLLKQFSPNGQPGLADLIHHAIDQGETSAVLALLKLPQVPKILPNGKWGLGRLSALAAEQGDMPSLRALLDLPLATKIGSEGRYGIGRIFYLVAKGKHWDDLKALLQTQLAPLLPAQGEHSTLTLLKMMAEELSGGAREAGGASGAGTG